MTLAPEHTGARVPAQGGTRLRAVPGGGRPTGPTPPEARPARRPGRLARAGIAALLVVGDVLAALLGAWAADHAQARWTSTPSMWERIPELDASLAPLLVPVAWVVLLSSTHGYEPRRAADATASRRHALLLGPALTTGVLVAAAVAGVEVDPRELLALALVTSLASVLHRTAVRAVQRRTETGRRVVVLGHRREVAEAVTELRRPGTQGTEVVGVCLHKVGRRARFDVPIGHGMDGLPALVDRLGADTVMVLPCRHVERDRLRLLAWDLEDRGAEMLVGAGLMDVAPTRARVHGGPGFPLLHVRPADLRSWRRRLLKSTWERGVAGLLLLLAAPLLGALALVVKLDSQGPVLFTQLRVGRDGRTFRIWKLRTMTHAAAGPDRALNDGAGPLFKMREDPRVTRVGGLLRKYSLDELPQLVQVLAGDMSLVGPRPPLPDEVDAYDDLARRRLAVKPGLTGAWQVSGRSDLSWQESVRLDLDYVDNWSVWTDLRILARTPGAVLGSRGAY